MACVAAIFAIGLTTNLEWNSLRMKGRTRPLSVLQIRADARAKYSRMSAKKMKGMLTPIREYTCQHNISVPIDNVTTVYRIFYWLLC